MTSSVRAATTCGSASCATARRRSVCSSCCSSSCCRSFPGLIAPYSPSAENFSPNLAPSAAHWLGTTSFGQDIFSQLIWGARQSLIIAFAAGAIATLDRRARRSGVRLSRGRDRRYPLDDHRHPARHPDLPALHRHRRVSTQRGPPRHHHHPRRAELVLQRPPAARASTLDAQPRLPQSSRRPRRAHQLHHHGRDAAVDELV